MDFFETIQKRHTIRCFTNAPISKQDLEKIVDAGRLAPSGRNLQLREFVVITDRGMIRHFSRYTDWVGNAAAIIAIVMDPSSRWWIEDGSSAAENILLAATALGYGGCWLEGVTHDWEAEFKAALEIPQPLRLFTIIPLGVPADLPTKEKKSLKQVLHWEKYSQI
jgi:nitroreductase